MVDAIVPGGIGGRVDPTPVATRVPKVVHTERDHRTTDLTTKSRGEKREGGASPQDLAGAVEKLNKTMELIERRLEFSVHEETNRIIVRVIDKGDDDKVIREIPPEKILDLVAKLRDAIGETLGLIVDERA